MKRDGAAGSPFGTIPDAAHSVQVVGHQEVVGDVLQQRCNAPGRCRHGAAPAGEDRLAIIFRTTAKQNSPVQLYKTA